jgi:hypothetical protein
MPRLKATSKIFTGEPPFVEPNRWEDAIYTQLNSEPLIVRASSTVDVIVPNIESRQSRRL